MKFTFFTFFLSFLFVSTLYGQSDNGIVRCSTDERHEALMQDPEYAAAWNQRMAKTKLELKKIKDHPKANCNEVLYVPVVVHYIDVTIGIDCAVDKALDQIELMNADFAGTNPDVQNWYDHQAATWPNTQNKESCIEFCLASLGHPAGSGIAEGDFAVTLNQYPDGTESAAEWSGYLNFFINGNDMGGVLGYSPLGGSGNGTGPVIALMAWGSVSCDGSNVDPTYGLGRTATHETGHYFALNHPFGGTCNNDNDAPLVNDTPITDQPTYGCPAPGSTLVNCVDPIVFPTYMEYCDDACLYMFTHDQVNGMEAHYNANLSQFADKAATTCQDAACLDFAISFTSSDETCLTGSDGTINIQALNANAPVNFSVSNGVTFQDNGAFTNLTADKYYIVVEDAAGCSAIDSVVIKREIPPLSIVSVQNSFCGDNGGSVLVNVNFPDKFQYSLAGDVPWQDTSYFGGLSAGAYEVVVRNDANCTNRMNVVVGDNSDLNLIERRIRPVNCPLFDNGLIDTYLSNGKPPFAFTLDHAQPQEEGYYDNLSPGNYVLNVRDSRGCELEKQFRIGISYATIGDGCPCDVFIPNAITADQDGLNDIFKPVFNCPFTQYRLQIFNRWGEMIFETQNSAEPWNGGEDDYYGNPGIYFYKLSYRWGEERNESLEVQTATGYITVLR